MEFKKQNQQIRFRPISKEDLSSYARCLSWLIEEPHNKTLQILSRIYGYADLHELQKELAKPGTPGPFDAPASKTRTDG